MPARALDSASLHHHHHHWPSLWCAEGFMASPQPSTAWATNPHTHIHPYTADDTSPPSPTAIAAATTLAALSDSRPPTASAEDADGLDDDDYSGGISLTTADLQHFTSDTSWSDTLTADEDMAMQSVMAQFESFPSVHPGGPPQWLYDYDSVNPTPGSPLSSSNEPAPASGYVPTMAQPHFGPISSTIPNHMLSSEHVLEPPPTLHEAHLSIQDRASFAPITSFFHYLTPGKRTVPGLDLVQLPDSITRDDLQGDSYDYQGIDWAVRNTTRSHVRAKRVDYESKKLVRAPDDVCKRFPPIPNKDNFFMFKRNNTTHRAFFPHFQLRNVLAATSRNDIYYAAGHRVFRTDADGSPADVILDLSKRLAPDGSITTIASTRDVLIAGAFEGEYAITDLSSTYGSPCTFGRTSDYAADTKSRIVNHMHLFESRRTYQPQAVLCSNDFRLRVLDCVTDTFTHSFLYPAAVNSAATSPDGRMRVVVGDFQETLITNAETGQPFETLNSHADDAFACAWADDGIHVATAAQDSTIVVWDARSWAAPIAVMKSELSVPRSLHFSPIGSGPRVLVAAEADDYVNVINAQTFESKQVFDFFGGIGGAAFTPDGQSLFIANGERRFGGIIELERTGWAERNRRSRTFDSTTWDERMADWASEAHLKQHDRVLSGDMQRERRTLELGDLII